MRGFDELHHQDRHPQCPCRSCRYRVRLLRAGEEHLRRRRDLPYPVYAKWAEAYKKETGIGLNYQSIGSGGGIKQIKAKTVTFGASDMPLKPEDLEKSGPGAVADDHGRRRAGRERRGHQARRADARRRR